MRNKRLLTFLSVILCLCSVTLFLSISSVSASTPAITISGDTYDLESGELSYRKATYSTNTSTVGTSSPEGAEYLFIPYSYEGYYTDSTCVSIKYKNTGVEFMPMYIEYGPGINAGGVDYPAGTEYICVNALSSNDSWNASFSKSVDGYDVMTIIFGNYASGVYDIALRGFRLYLDLGKEVTSERTFEFYGCDVHEEGTTPSFASDPKGCRLSKLTSADVQLVNNACVIEESATLSAYILDYSTDFKKMNFSFTTSQAISVNIKLDDESVSLQEYGVGTHVVTVNFTKSNYSKLDIVLTSENCNFKINKLELVATPYVGDLTGTDYTVTKQGDSTVVKYTFKTNWQKLSAPIRQYSQDFDCLLIEFECNMPIVIGMMIDDVYLYSHWEHTSPLNAGEHSFFFNLGDLVGSDSSLIFYLDPAITGYAGLEGEKVVTFTNIEFKDSTEMQKATINVNSKFEFDYDGQPKEASGATTNSGETLIYEYKPVFADERAYDTEKPVDAGEYDVRITSALNMTYATTYAYSKLIINKIEPSLPTASSIDIDFNSSKVYYDAEIFAVSESEDFAQILPSGSGVLFGTTLYVKYVESTNYFESQAISVTLDKKEGDISVSVNVERETTVEIIGDDCEYSKDGLNWTVGQGKRIMLEPGNIYLFRKRATSTSFAGKITYIAIPYRMQAPALPELEATNSTSITVKQVAGVEYRLSDTVWQDSNYFDYLQEGQTVTVYIRIKAQNGTFASEEVCATFTVGQMPGSQSSNSSVATEKSGCKGAVAGANGLALLFTAGILVCFITFKKRGKVR